MAQISVEAPVLTMRGKLGQLSRIVYRQKMYSVGSHHYAGPIEAYVVKRPRNRRKNPPSPAEQAAIDRFRKACNEAKKQLADPEQRAYWVQRFEYQMSHPEPSYGKNKRVGETRVFLQLSLYVRTMLLRQYTQEAKQPLPTEENTAKSELTEPTQSPAEPEISATDQATQLAETQTAQAAQPTHELLEPTQPTQELLEPTQPSQDSTDESDQSATATLGTQAPSPVETQLSQSAAAISTTRTSATSNSTISTTRTSTTPTIPTSTTSTSTTRTSAISTTPNSTTPTTSNSTTSTIPTSKTTTTTTSKSAQTTDSPTLKTTETTTTTATDQNRPRSGDLELQE